MSSSRRPRIGLILGGGSARGWAHIGVIRELEQAGIKPDFVCGTSIGALVGAVYASGELDQFEQWVLGLNVSEIVSYLDVSLTSGLLKGDRLMEFFRRDFVDRTIEELEMPFGAVATSLNNGTEIWLRQGSVLDAVRASIALPGLFTPVLHDELILVDGGLVNPVPVSLGRAMGADILIAVDLNSDALSRHVNHNIEKVRTENNGNEWVKKLKDGLGFIMPDSTSKEVELPSMLDVLATSINIMQIRITRSRLAGEPPDFIVAPKLADIGLLDFHRAKESIEEGKRAVQRIMHSLTAEDNLMTKKEI